MAGFSTHVTHEETRPVMHLTGEIDIERADEVASLGILTVQAMDADMLVIDMSQVSFLDSSGISALIRIRKAAQTAGRTVTIRSPDLRVRRVLSITGLAEVFGLDEPHGNVGGLTSPTGRPSAEGVPPRSTIG
ncbi:MAG: STAS domain-containing protein [Actinomycetota bacterium]|nr:STAS domain-containing protein [Actinomycetota bacterium]